MKTYQYEHLAGEDIWQERYGEQVKFHKDLFKRDKWKDHKDFLWAIMLGFTYAIKVSQEYAKFYKRTIDTRNGHKSDNPTEDDKELDRLFKVKVEVSKKAWALKNSFWSVVKGREAEHPPEVLKHKEYLETEFMEVLRADMIQWVRDMLEEDERNKAAA